MAKTSKRKVDYKGKAKDKVKELVKNAFPDYEIIDMKEANISGYTKDTLILRNVEVDGSVDTIDVQIKLITPSATVGNHYQLEEEEEEE